MINYRYDICKKLGEGGSGEVFLAEDALFNKRQCAIKVLHDDGQAGDEAAAAFRNEVSVLLQLEHPNLVRILDFGMIRSADPSSLQGRRFLAMEFVQGSDSLEWLSKLPYNESRHQIVEIVLLQALSALSYIHREGIIHFDIKPQNLVLVGEANASSIPILKLMDFGFSSKQDDTTGLSIRGTLEYTAPELLRGEAGDHRIDLYSLGATFFHLLTGRCPFEAANPVDLVKLVLTEAPALVSQKQSRCHEVVSRLLEKDPQKRFPDAEHVARFLVEDKANAGELLESYFGVSRKSRFVGRKSERRRLESAVDAIVNGESTSAKGFLISGTEGIGKTSLIAEISKYARSRDLTVTSTEALFAGIPFEGISSVISQLGYAVRSYSDEGARIYQKYENMFGLFRDDKSAMLRDWTKESEKSTELLARFITECSSILPLVIVADNSHTLDEQSLGVLKAAIRDLPSGKGLILAAETSETAQNATSLMAEEIRLHDLAPEEVSEMSSSIFGSSELSVEVGSSIYRLYGGTPGVVVEAFSAARDVVTDKLLRTADRVQDLATSFETRLPRTLDDFLLRRFRKLNSERQLILSVLSCFQNPAPLGVVAGVLPFHPRRFSDQLRFLQLEGFVSESENDSLLLIRMKRLKDAVYSSIATQQVELHGLIAEAFEQKYSNGTFQQLQELAFQFTNCDQKRKAALYCEKAGTEGLRLFAFQKSLQYLTEAIAIAKELGDVAWELSLRLKLVTGLFRSGAYTEVVQGAEELKDHAALTEVGRFLLLKTLGLSFSRLGEVDPAEKHIQMALALATSEADRLELRQELIGIKIATGAFHEAEKQCREQLENATKLHQDGIVASIYTDMGIATFYQDRFSFAAECFTQSLHKYESLNERTQVINSMNNVANALSAGGEYGHAIEFLEKGLAASREYGTRTQQAQVLNNLGIAHYNLKKYQQAKVLYNEARSLYDRAASRVGIASTLINLGEVQCADGDYELSIANLQSAHELYAQLENPHARLDSCLQLADVFLVVGDLQAMDRVLDEAWDLLEQSEFASFGSVYAYLRGMNLMAQKDFTQAEQSLNRAIELASDRKPDDFSRMVHIKLAECKYLLRQYTQAVKVITDLLSTLEGGTSPRVVAEANYVLGLIAISAPDVTPEKPLVYFKHGLDAIAKEPVSEITWKLAFALAREYYERGQRERAKEFLVKTKLVMQFFLSRFHSADLKNLYLNVDQKRDVIATIDSLTKQ